MDRQHAPNATDILRTAPVIRRADDQAFEATSTTFVPAAQSKLLNGVLGSAWAFQLAMIFTATSPTDPAEAAPIALVGFATVLLLGLMFLMVAVVAFAAGNDARTAPLSFGIAIGTIVFGALCGLAGHPASAWLSDLAFGAVVAAGSVAVFARRA